MSLRKIIVSAGVIGMLAVTPALAGDASLKNSADGTKLRINCKSSGCVVREKKKGGKWTVISNSAGGSKNFKKLMAEYKDAGFQ